MKTTKRRVAAALMTISLLATLLPTTAFAAGTASIAAKSVPISVADTVLVSKITLSQTQKAASTGDKFQLTTTLYPSNATNRSLRWYSSNTSVATVDQNGYVTVVGGGYANICVQTTDGSAHASCMVSVSTYSLTIETDGGGRIIRGTSGAYKKGTKINISASAYSGYKFDQWYSSNGGTFANHYRVSTTFIMPAANTVLTAYFKDSDTSSGSDSTDSGYSAGTTSDEDVTKYGVRIGTFSDYDKADKLCSALKQLGIYCLLEPDDYTDTYNVNVKYYKDVKKANAVQYLLNNRFYSPIHTNANHKKYGINIYPFRDSDRASTLSDALDTLHIYHIFEMRGDAYQIRIEWFGSKARADAMNYVMSNSFYNEVFTHTDSED